MKRFLAAVVLMLTFASATVALASTVMRLDFDQLVEVSDLVVVAHITAVDGVERDGRIFTHIGVSVDETLKGEPRDSLEIIHIGGRTETLVTMVHGMPSFTVGEHTLLFLEQPKGVDHFVVTGLAQGKMAVKSTDGGELRLKASPNQPRLVGPAHTSITPKVTTLDQARQRIKVLLTKTPAQ